MPDITKDDMSKKIILGTAGLAFAAGALTTGVLLTNPEARKKLRSTVRQANKGLMKVRGVIEEGKDRYQAIAHTISRGRKKSNR